jgi:aryl-alcohol dehydrogenase-like predicted oxidoreductase
VPGPGRARNLRLVSLLRTIGKRRGHTPAEVAVAWVWHNPAVTGAIVGARRPGQVRGVVGAGAFRLSPREVAEIEAFLARATAGPVRDAGQARAEEQTRLTDKVAS